MAWHGLAWVVVRHKMVQVFASCVVVCHILENATMATAITMVTMTTNQKTNMEPTKRARPAEQDQPVEQNQPNQPVQPVQPVQPSGPEWTWNGHDLVCDMKPGILVVEVQTSVFHETKKCDTVVADLQQMKSGINIEVTLHSSNGEYMTCYVENKQLGLYFEHYRQRTHVTLDVNSPAAQDLLTDLIDDVTQSYM
jgi:hypothetical protein